MGSLCITSGNYMCNYNYLKIKTLMFFIDLSKKE